MHLISPRSEFQAPAEIVENVTKHDIVIVHQKTSLKAVIGNGEVTAIRLASQTGREFDLPVKGVFVYLQGGQPGTSFLNGALERGAGGCVVVNRTTMETTVPGVYAVGDVTCARLKQAVISAAEGAVAAISADKYIHRTDKISPGRYW